MLVGAMAMDVIAPGWKHHQKAYGVALLADAKRKASSSGAKYPVQVRQIVLPELNRTDRCVSCHVGIGDPGALDLPQPLTAHPGNALEIHEADDYGCTVCHDGQSRALGNAWEGHGELRDWPAPLLRGEFVQASCHKCHEDIDRLPGAPLLARGKTVFEEFGCHNCHVVEGYEGKRKIGPSLNTVADKVDKDWLIAWLKEPSSYLQETRMPEFRLSDVEAGYIASFLLSLRSKKDAHGQIQWPEWAAKQFEELDDDQFDAMDELVTAGKGIWGQARCSICHARDGVGGETELGSDLGRLVTKTNRNWLFRWVRNPRSMDQNAQMPHYRFTDEQVRSLIEYVVRDEKFGGMVEGSYPALQAAFPAAVADQASIAEGRRLVKRYTCNGCHSIPEFPDELKLADLSHWGSKPLEKLDFGNLIGEIPATLIAWTMEKLHDPRRFRGKVPGEGKLADSEVDELKMPVYGFSEEDIKAVTIYLLSRTGEEMPDAYRVGARSGDYQPPGAFGAIVDDINCFACHRINGRGGIYAPELSREGSIVRRKWMAEFLRKPDVLRPMLQQMPNLGLTEEEAGVLTEYIKVALADRRIPHDLSLEGGAGPPGRASREKGEALYQDKGCKACHQIGPVGGSLGPPLTHVGDRLEPGYIFSYLKSPQSFHPDAVQPNYGLSDEDALSLTIFLNSLRKEPAR